MFRILLSVLSLVSFTAVAMERVEVDDAQFATASLTIVRAETQQTYDPAALEALGTYVLRTVTPWQEAPAEFVGVRLQDLLATHGIAQAPAIRVVAENGFTVTIERENWVEHAAMVATRVDRKAHSRRERGPLQFVFDKSRDPHVGSEAFEKNWVWMATHIEPADLP